MLINTFIALFSLSLGSSEGMQKSSSNQNYVIVLSKQTHFSKPAFTGIQFSHYGLSSVINISGRRCDTDEVILHFEVEFPTSTKNFLTANKPLQLPQLLGKTTLMIASLHLKGFLVSLIFYFQFTFTYSRVMNIYNMQSPPPLNHTLCESFKPSQKPLTSNGMKSRTGWLCRPRGLSLHNLLKNKKMNAQTPPPYLSGIQIHKHKCTSILDLICKVQLKLFWYASMLCKQSLLYDAWLLIQKIWGC